MAATAVLRGSAQAASFAAFFSNDAPNCAIFYRQELHRLFLLYELLLFTAVCSRLSYTLFSFPFSFSL